MELPPPHARPRRAFAWEIGSLALILLFATAIATHADLATSQARGVTRIACYIAMANDLTPLLIDNAPDLAARSKQCNEDSKIRRGA